METAGYTAAIFIGITLGLIGGVGSILTVPVLVYLFGTDAVAATTYSLFIVGTTSLAGSIAYFRKGLVSIRTAAVFGIPSVAAVFLTRTLIVPSIPPEIFSAGNFTLTNRMLLMLLFAALMILASYSMIRKGTVAEALPEQPFHYPMIFIQGIFTGAVTSLIGAGGGFLIIPALVHLLKLPLKTAIGTSLVIITVNSLAGFFFSVHHFSVDWSFLIPVTSIAVTGISPATIYPQRSAERS